MPKHTDGVAVEWQRDYPTRTRTDTHTHAYTLLGSQTRWPEGCSCPITVRQVSEYDSNPSEGRTHTRSSLCILSSPPCALGSRHTVSKAQSFLLLNSAAAFCLPVRGSVEKTRFRAGVQGAAILCGAILPGFVLLLPPPQSSLFTLPHLHWLDVPARHQSSLCFFRYRWLLGQHLCLPCWISDAFLAERWCWCWRWWTGISYRSCRKREERQLWIHKYTQRGR